MIDFSTGVLVLCAFNFSGASDTMSYRCYKKKNSRSVSLLACCDGFYKFIWVSSVWGGNTNDGLAWNESSLKRHLHSGQWPVDDNGDRVGFTIEINGLQVRIPAYVVVDSAFALAAYAMKQFGDNDGVEAKSVFDKLVVR